MKRVVTALIAVSMAFGVAACGHGGSKEPVAAAAPSTPHRIVSLSPTATEILFAVGAGQQVVAVDSNSDYPPEAPKTDLSAYEPNVEAIANQHPDLVVISDDVKGVKSQLEQIHVPVLVQPAATTLDDTYAQITDLGQRTGHADGAARLVTSMKQDIDALSKSVPARATPLTYYYELDNTLFTVTSTTFIGQLFSMAGLTNVADPADANGQSGGYPQLSAEFLVQSNPDVVFLADTKCCAQDAATFAARPGFNGLKAVQSGHVVLLDDDVASRWGPRVVDLLRAVVDATKGMAPT